MKHLLRLLGILLCTLVVASCKWEGTDTGNPQMGNVAAPVPISADFVSLVRDGVCAVIADCYGTSHNALCEQEISSAQAIPEALGFSGDYATLDGLMQNGLAYSHQHLQECLLAVVELSCEDPVVAEAYDPSVAGDFSGTFRLFEASHACNAVGVE